MNYYLIIIYLLTFSFMSNGQSLIKEELRIKLIESVIKDGEIHCLGDDFEEYKKCFNDIYNNTNIIKSVSLEGELFLKKKKFHTFYRMELYKITSRLNFDRYMLLYKDIEHQTWYRIGGYKENDFIHFYEKVLCQYLSNKQIKQLIDEWKEQDSLFSEIDFNCLIDGVKSKSTEFKCYESATLLLQSHSSIGYLSDQLYSIVNSRFSIRPYSGDMPIDIRLKRNQ